MSMFFGNIIFRNRILLDKEKEGGGGGGGGNPPPDNAKELADLKASNDALMKRLEALEGKGNPPPKKEGEEDDLAAKAKKEREAKEKSDADSAKTEKALTFNLKAAEFIKTNATLLPKNIESIFAQAEKEKYANAIEKADALKVALVSEFFAIQSNLDLLTDSQKNALAEFKELTKTVKQERVQHVYDMVFEPAFESLKRITKARQVRDGEIDPSDAKAAYAKRMADLSRAKYIKK